MKKALVLFAAVLTIAFARAEEPVAFEEIISGRRDYQLVPVEAEVKDAFPDATDPDFFYLLLEQRGVRLYAAFESVGKTADFFYSLIGARIAFTAKCSLGSHLETRRRSGHVLFSDRPSEIRVVTPAPSDPFEVPEFRVPSDMQPEEIARLGRRRIEGRVIAVWGKGELLVRIAGGDVLRVNLAQEEVPPVGSQIELVGMPGTDIYRLTLSRAVWRAQGRRAGVPADGAEKSVPACVGVSAIVDAGDHYNVRWQGRSVRLRGKVISMPGVGDRRLYLEGDGRIVPVTTERLEGLPDDLAVDAVVEVAAICVFDIDPWRPDAPYPRIRGFFLVPASSADLVVVRSPPFFTIGRLLALFLLVVAVFAGFLVRARLAVGRSRVKFEERTRLAVELHDSLSQCLTGVSFEMETASGYSEGANQELRRHLGIASKALASCRDELKNCLWDLRNSALDGTDLSLMIRRALQPLLPDSGLSVRFAVPHSLLGEQLLHDVICIVRELAANGLRHGGATTVAIAGAVEEGCLLFSVRNNGEPFDPSSAPGVLEGHFGMQGIRERLRRYHGTLVYENLSPRGVRAKVRIAL